MTDYFRSDRTREKEIIRVKILQEIEMRIVIRIAAWLILGLSAILTVQAQSGATAAEQQLFVSVNQARRNAGVAGVEVE